MTRPGAGYAVTQKSRQLHTPTLPNPSVGLRTGRAVATLPNPNIGLGYETPGDRYLRAAYAAIPALRHNDGLLQHRKRNLWDDVIGGALLIVFLVALSALLTGLFYLVRSI